MSKRPYNPQTRYYLRGLAGLYLLYLAWSLRPELTKPGLMKLAPIFFALIGLAFALSAAYAIFWQDKPTEEEEESASDDPDAFDEEEEEEDAATLPDALTEGREEDE